MIGPDESIPGFTKNLYLYISIAIAIVAGVIVYSAAQGNTESSLQLLSKTSQRFARALTACKTATFDIAGNRYVVVPQGTVKLDADGNQVPVLNYTRHAVRGNVNSDAYYDMLCTYDLIAGDGTKKSYVGALFGAENESFFPGPMLLIGPNEKIDALSISGGIGMLSYTEGDPATGEKQYTKRFFLDGDTLSFADNGLGGL